MRNYLNLKPAAALLICAAVSLAGVIFCLLFKDTIVITGGILFYRKLRTALLCIFVILLTAGIILLFKEVGRARKSRKADEIMDKVNARTLKEEARKKKEDGEILSVKKDMDSAKLHRVLEERETKEWPEYTQLIYKCITHLNEMDKQQEKLQRLISLNGADVLSDSMDVLDDAEQYICKNIRKAINYMDVANRNNPEESKKAEEQLKITAKENDEVLKQVSKFMFAMADFLNHQGDDGDEMQMLEMYKNAILECTGGKYGKL